MHHPSEHQNLFELFELGNHLYKQGKIQIAMNFKNHNNLNPNSRFRIIWITLTDMLVYLEIMQAFKMQHASIFLNHPMHVDHFQEHI